MILSAAWTNEMEPILADAYEAAFDQWESIIPTFVTVRDSSKQVETTSSAGDMTPATVFTSGDEVVYDDFYEGYSVTASHVEFFKGIVYERRVLDDIQYPDLIDGAGQVGNAMAEKFEIEGHKFFNSAFTTGTDADGYNATGGDAVALCSASHPSQNPGQPVRSNLITGTAASAISTLTYTNLRTAFTNMLKTLTPAGLPFRNVPDKVVVPIDLWDEADIIVSSRYNPDTAENDVNVMYGKLDVVVLRYAASDMGGNARNWFLVNTALAKKYWRCWVRIPPEFHMTGNFDNFTLKIGSYARICYRFNDWYPIYGMQVT